MADKKQLSSFPEYVRVNEAVRALRAEREQLLGRIEAANEELSQPQQHIDGKTAWECALEGRTYNMEVDVKSSLREELQWIQARLAFIDEALSVGEMEVDKVVGKVSLQICATVRPQWIAEVRKILEHLKALSLANEKLDELRTELESDGIRTDSLVYSKYDLGKWNDGKTLGYQRFIADSFPELASAAGQEIKARLRALAQREQEYNEQQRP